MIVIAGCLVLQYFGVPIDAKFVPGLIALLLVGIYEIVLEAKKTHDKADEQFLVLGEEVRKLSHAASSLVEQLSPKLYALFQCKQELELTLDHTQLGSKVSIDHLGLNMGQAWEYVHQLLFGPASKLTDIEYRLLIISPNKRDTWPQEVQDWAESVPASLKRIESDLKKVIQQFERTNKRCKIEIRHYDSVPVVHGWSVRQPVKTWHVAFCRWNDCYYDWGEHHYVKVDQFTRTPVVGDVADVFDSYFERLWTTATEQPELRFQTATRAF